MSPSASCSHLFVLRTFSNDHNSDLVLEKEFLSSLVHPHIIKLRGVTRMGPTGFALIIDHLVETLDQRMRRWRSKSSSRRAMTKLTRSMSSLSSSFTANAKPEQEEHERGTMLDNRLCIGKKC